MKRAFLIAAAVLLIATHALAGPVTLTREYSYLAGDADSKLSSRSIALEQVKRLLLEELGTYLVSNTIVRNSQLSKDEIVTYTAGAVVTVILEEKWDGTTYYLKAKLTADPDNVAKSLAAIKNDQERKDELNQLRRQTTDSLQEIARLKMELAEAKKAPVAGANPAKSAELQRKYTERTGELAAKEFLEQGIMLRNEKKYGEAVAAYTKAIKLAPDWGRPFAGRGAAYLKLKNYSQGEQDLERAGAIDPNNMFALSFHGVSLMQQGRNRAGMGEIERAVAAEPGNYVTNLNMGWALLQQSHPRKAITFLTRAIELSQGKQGRPFFLRAKAFKQLGDHDKFRADMERAEALGEVPPAKNRPGRQQPQRIRQ
jgi:tetratricopeptide (TPR) repeat protein